MSSSPGYARRVKARNCSCSCTASLVREHHELEPELVGCREPVTRESGKE